jgi:hypothetical protein
MMVIMMIRSMWQDGQCDHGDQLRDKKKDMAMLRVIFRTELIRNDKSREEAQTQAKR